jgi:hypothetical protein
MRSQASEWAAYFSPEILAFRLPRVFSYLKAAPPRRHGESKGEPAGWSSAARSKRTAR